MAPVIAVNTTRSTRLIAALRKRWFVVVIAGVVGGLGAFALSYTITPVYHASASLFFSLRTGTSGSDINQGSTYTQNQMLSYAALATSAIVVDGVSQDIGASMSKNDILRSLSVTAPQNTVILEVKADTADPSLSARIANSAADHLAKAVSQVSPVESTTNSSVVAHVIDPAVAPQFQSSPNKKQNALFGGILGVALSILAILLTALLDTRVRSVAVLKSMTERPLLGFAESTRPSRDSRPIALRLPNGSATERFRQIRAGLRFASASHATTTIAVTSAIPGEGKTVTALNLALVMAETKERILLIDADLRRPRVADYIGFEEAIGLTTVLLGDIPLHEATQRFSDTTLEILSAGSLPPNPAELLGSTRMASLIAQAKEIYDFVIIDTAPVLSVADVSGIAQLVDSIVLVVDASKLRQIQLEQASDVLDSAGAHVSGIILNRVRASKRRDVYYDEYKRKTPRASTRAARTTPAPSQDSTGGTERDKTT